MLFTLLDHTGLICQASKTWISTVLTNQKLTLLDFLFMQFYVSQGMLAQLSLQVVMPTQVFIRTYDKVISSVAAQQTLLKCGNSLDVDEDIIDELLKFTRNVIYGDNKSSSMAEVCADKWKAMKKKSLLRIPPDTDCLRQHFIHANYSTYLVHHILSSSWYVI